MDGAKTPGQVTEALARFALGRSILPDEMAARVALSLFDWVAVGQAGLSEPVARLVREMALSDGGVPAASVMGGGHLPARAAALVNGTVSHALDYDDTHFLHIGHPSVAVAPAALAVGEAESASGAEFLGALAIGLETACRVGDWLGRDHYRAGFHQTGTAGAFGAAAAAGRLMGLDELQMRHAFGLVATRAAGLKNQFGTMGKPLNAGFAAEVGVVCADLARRGAISTGDALEGSAGFGATHAGMARSEALAGLGRDWVFQDINWKFHACCHGTHAALEALIRLRDAHDLDPRGIGRIRIATHPLWLDVCDKPAPETGLEAKFSYRFTAAMALLRIDTGDLTSFDDRLCQRPDLRALAQRVEVVGDASLSDTAAHVVVETAQSGDLRNGCDLTERLALPDAERRLRKKAASLIGADRTEALWQHVGGVGTARTLAALTQHIREPAVTS